MINPDDYWVNDPLMTKINKALMYDNAIWMAKMDEQDRVIEIFHEAFGHNGKTHHEGSDCWFCKTVKDIRK